MDKKTLHILRKQLMREKALIKKDMLRFASKNKKVPDDYKTRYPFISGGDTLDDQAAEVEIYASRLAIEHALETRLKEISEAFDKIKQNKYGICEKCHQEIELEKLKDNPAARFCLKCKN